MDTHFLTLPDGTLAYDDQGAGPLVLCAPSLGDVRAEYRFLVPQLVAAGYRVVTMDIRGHGETSVKWPDYTVGAVGSDMLELIEHLNAGPAFIIGTSMAAGAGVYAAAERPELVSGLVLISPFVRIMAPAWQSRLLNIVYALLIAPFWGAAFWSRYYTGLYPTQRPADFAAYLDKLKKNMQEPGRLHALYATLADNKAASDARLARVHVPVHIVMGSRDSDFKSPDKEMQLLVGRLHASSQMIEGAGHYPHAEMPEQTAPSILNFLKTSRERIVHGN